MLPNILPALQTRCIWIRERYPDVTLRSCRSISGHRVDDIHFPLPTSGSGSVEYEKVLEWLDFFGFDTGG